MHSKKSTTAIKSVTFLGPKGLSPRLKGPLEQEIGFGANQVHQVEDRVSFMPTNRWGCIIRKQTTAIKSVTFSGPKGLSP